MLANALRDPSKTPGSFTLLDFLPLHADDSQEQRQAAELERIRGIVHG